MKTKKTQTVIRAAIVLGILIVLNFISVRLFTRFDLTKAGVYTLSDASKTLVRNLDDRLTIKAYFTDNLPAPYNSNRRQVLDMLNDYKAYAKGNLQFEFISPDGEKSEHDAQEAGVMPVEVQALEKDQLVVKKAYLGLVMLYEDKKETLPVIQNVGSFEYDLSSAIKRLTQHARKRIGYTTGHGEAGLDAMKKVSQEIQKQYDLVPVDLSTSATVIPQDLSALLIVSPSSKFNDTAKCQIDQYLMHGGKIAFLLNAVNASLQQRMTQPVDLGLNDLLENYGVRVNSDLVRDAQCANITVMQQEGQFQFQSQVPFPYIVIASNFNRNNAIVKDLQELGMYFVSSVDTAAAASKGLHAEVIIRSSKRSGKSEGMMPLDPMHRYTQAEFSESGIPVAAVVTGSFKSLYAGKMASAVLTQSSADARIVAVGDGDFLKDEYLVSRGNLNFAANIVDYLADDAGLITIRSKEIAMPPLDAVSDGTKETVKWSNFFLPPLIVIGYGLMRWRRRKALKRALEQQLA